MAEKAGAGKTGDSEMSKQEEINLERCAVVSCFHNLAYGGGPPEKRRCKKGREPDFSSHARAGKTRAPCGKEYESGIKNDAEKGVKGVTKALDRG